MSGATNFLISPPLGLTWPLQLEYMRAWSAALLFVALGLPVLWMGMRSLAGLGKARKWTSIALRLLVILLLVLLIAGARWSRVSKDVEVLVLRDKSQSVLLCHDYPSDSVESSLDQYLTTATDDQYKKRDDTIGMIAFDESAYVESIPNTTLTRDTRPIEDFGNGTDIAYAIQLGLTTFKPGTMRRMLLVSDGNSNMGDLDQAIDAAASQHVPIDVMPLDYSIDHEVMMERMIVPTWKREKEPFTIELFLRSTNITPVGGKVTLTMRLSDGTTVPINIALNPADAPGRRVVLKPGLTRIPVTIPGLESGGVYTFKATFEADRREDAEKVTTQIPGAVPGEPGAPGGVSAVAGRGKQPVSPYIGDTLTSNNTAEGFVFVRGKGKVLYIDNVYNPQGQRAGGEILEHALEQQGIQLDTRPVEAFPSSLIELQNYDAVILSNVPHGLGGITEDKAKMLASYVHDLGGGLLMIGGPDTFGAGGWEGSKLEEILPVNMDIPAQRQMPKGALVLVMHSCEMPQGNYWGEQCALKAIDTLGARDQVGIISYNWGGVGAGGIGGAQWDYVLSEKGDGSRVIKAAHAMQLGDMPSFDDALNLAMNGVAGGPCLKNSDAAQKHVIVISDGDPAMPSAALIKQYQDAKIAISTVTVFTHNPGVPSPQMVQMAQQTGGRVYGPIESNPNQLPQIFIKEASTVRRSLIYESNKGIPVRQTPSPSELLKGVTFANAINGMVLTSLKSSPNVEEPLVAGKNSDPLLAEWQAGLGKAVVFTSDAQNRWAPQWVASPDFGRFWAQAVRSIARPPMSTDFDMQVVQTGDKGHIRVEAANKESSFLNFLNIRGKVIGPDMKPHDVRLEQTGPGTYESDFDAGQQGNYVVLLNYQGGKETAGTLVSGMSVSTSPEDRDLQSNDELLKQIADRTGGRLLTPWDAQHADLFERQGLASNTAPLPIWDVLIPILLGLLLLDVASRRIAWDWAAIQRLGRGSVKLVRSFTTTRKVETRQTLDALQRVRQEVAEQKFDQNKSLVEAGAKGGGGAPAVPAPDRSAKFEASGGVEGDISKVVGGASDKPVPAPPKKIEPKGAPPAPGSHTGSLLEAKRRAQQQIREKEGGDGKSG